MNAFWKDFSPIFIVSTGRTGTKFLATLINKLFKDVDAIHEPKPDVLKLRYQFATKKISLDKAKKDFIKKRYKLYKSIKKQKSTFYLESNPYLTLLIPIIQDLFEEYKIIYIVRDGRDWVRSAISRGIYDSFIHKTSLPLIPLLRIFIPQNVDLLNKIKKINFNAVIRDIWRIRAIDFKDDLFKENWSMMTQFEKLSWKWKTLDELSCLAMKGDARCKKIHFEDIFSEKEHYKGFHELIKFSNLSQNWKSDNINLNDIFSKKINITQVYKIPEWKDWNEKHISQFKKIAGERLEFHGYKWEY